MTSASTPWRVIVEHVEDSPPLVYICDRENHVIAWLPEHRWEHRTVFDTLVRCVNEHAELLDALREAVLALAYASQRDKAIKPVYDKVSAMIEKSEVLSWLEDRKYVEEIAESARRRAERGKA